MIFILDNGVPKNPKILLDVGRWASWVPLLGAAMLTLPSYPNSVSFFKLHPALPANSGAQLLLLFFSLRPSSARGGETHKSKLNLPSCADEG